MCEHCPRHGPCAVCGEEPIVYPAGPIEVFRPDTGAVVIVTDDPADAAEFAARWGLDWAPEGWGHL